MSLVGTMAVYGSQAEASENIPKQWRAFVMTHAASGASSKFYGASPCTSDGKIHYLTGVLHESSNNVTLSERVVLDAGDYAVVVVNDPSQLRDTWTWLLSSWLPSSGRREKAAPEFERFTAISEDGSPAGPVEIWIPVHSL